MTVYLDRDHNAIEFTEKVYSKLSEIYNIDFIRTDETVPYPLIAKSMAERVVGDSHSLGILVCKTGIGMAIVSNKVQGAYANNCKTVEECKNFKSSNMGNILCLGATSVTVEEAVSICKAFIDIEFNSVNTPRIDLIKKCVDVETNIDAVKQAFERNNIGFVYASNVHEALKFFKQRFNSPLRFSFGGSQTLLEIGLRSFLIDNGHNYCDANDCDVYFSGSNAITADGIIVNADRRANRVSAIAHGTKRVYIVVGKNKLVHNQEEGLRRIKSIAAPLNAKRLSANTPCAKLGHCISNKLFDGCDSSDRLCCQFLITAFQKVKNRITIVYIDENLGF